MMKLPTRSAVATLAVAFVLTLPACDSSTDDVLSSCVDECDREGQKLCRSDTQYRECVVRDGCLQWDCGT
jgi:hypothetical protein